MRFRKLAILVWLPITATLAVETDFYAGQDAFKRGEYAVAHRVWLELARDGDGEAQFRLARLYVEGKGVDADAAEAVRWYRSAAAQGHARAQAGLGFMLHTGRGVEPDLAEAIEWYRKAAIQGRASAQFNLGKIHLDGEGVDVDEAEALRWFQMAADQGYPAALNSLARMYEEGRGIEPDPARAFKLTKRAAKERYPEAEFQLGRMFAEGSGTAQDTKKALHYYQRASNQGQENARAALDLMVSTPTAAARTPGDAPAETETIATAAVNQAPPPVVDTLQPGAEWTPQQQFEHGRALLFGDGVARDPNRAEDWLRMAAEGGHGEAAYRLGLLLYRGHSGAAKAHLQAYVWFARAAGHGIGDAATWRDRAYAKLNEREREDARRLLDP